MLGYQADGLLAKQQQAGSVPKELRTSRNLREVVIFAGKSFDEFRQSKAAFNLMELPVDEA